MLQLLKELKMRGYISADHGMDRIYYNTNQSDRYIFTYRDKPNSKIEDIIHLMVK